MTRCGRCGHYQRASDPRLASQFGKCLHREDGVWIPPAHPVCPAFSRSTPFQRRYTTLLGLALLVDSIVIPGAFWVVVVSFNPRFQSSPWLLAVALLLAGLGVPLATVFFLLFLGRKRRKAF